MRAVNIIDLLISQGSMSEMKETQKKEITR